MATDIIAQRQMSCLAGLANMALTTEEPKSGFEPLSSSVVEKNTWNRLRVLSRYGDIVEWIARIARSH